MKNLSCDIVVIGGGGSGLIAGCRASCLGKSVIVLEKTKSLGGGMNGASTMRTFGSRWQKERNLPDTTALYMRNRMDETYWRLDRAFAKNIILGTGRFFDWFCDIAPKETVDKFTPGRYVFDGEDGPIGPQCGGPGKGKGSGRIFVETASEKLLANGGSIMTEMITDGIITENGRVRGVKAHSGDESYEIACSAVILASGSWIRNPDIVKRVYPELYASLPYMGESPHMNRAFTGDGLGLARRAGALINENEMTIRMMGPMTMCRSQVFSNMTNSAYCIYVNQAGKRYVCESSQFRMGVFDSGSVMMEHTHGISYIIFDENNLRHAVEAGGNQPRPQLAMPMPPAAFPATMEEAKADMASLLENGGGEVFSADSIEELAEKIGVDAAGLGKTVADYNDAAETGMDWDCYKPPEWLTPMNEAPFYAVKAELGTDGAFGGVEINENMQVKAADGGLVSGLYAVGDIANGRFINMAGIKKQILNDMSFAVSSGYLAGTHAAEKL